MSITERAVKSAAGCATVSLNPVDVPDATISGLQTGEAGAPKIDLGRFERAELDAGRVWPGARGAERPYRFQP